MESISNLRVKLHQLAFFDPVSAGLGIGGLLLQNSANNDAKKAQKKAQGSEKEIRQRQIQLFDEMLAKIKGHDFSAGTQLDQLKADTDYYSQRDTSNSASAARSLGYKPGDTAPLKSIRSIDSKYKLNYAQQANQIRRNAFSEELGAYGMLGGGSSLNSAAAGFNNQANQAGAQVQPLTGMVGSMQSFLQPKAKVNTGGINPNAFANMAHYF